MEVKAYHAYKRSCPTTLIIHHANQSCLHHQRTIQAHSDVVFRRAWTAKEASFSPAYSDSAACPKTRAMPSKTKALRTAYGSVSSNDPNPAGQRHVPQVDQQILGGNLWKYQNFVHVCRVCGCCCEKDKMLEVFCLSRLECERGNACL